jgi:hypothetical protein
LYLNQAGLGMPDRRYYLLEEFARERRGYREYARRLLALVKWPNPVESAMAVVAFEGRIAEASWTAAEQRDAVKSFNPMSVAELTAFAPGFPWQEFLAGAHVADVQRVVVGEKSAFPKIAAIFAAPVGSDCDCGQRCGGNGKHRVVAEQLYWRWESVRGWPTTRRAAGAAPGTSLGPKPSLLGFPMLTSTRLDFRP